jgi:formate dehydrogenase maturation protein FdhE
MEIQEAIEILHRLTDGLNEDGHVMQANVMAINALKKQIPGKVKPTKIEGLGKCPVCKTDLCIDDNDLHYCPTCGQALKL